MHFSTQNFFSRTYNNKNQLWTMENDVAVAIKTTAPTSNEGKEENSISVELVDEEERFQDGYRDGEPVII